MNTKQILLLHLLTTILLFSDANSSSSKSIGKLSTEHNTSINRSDKIKKNEHQPYNLQEISEKLQETLKEKTPHLRETKNRRFLTKFYRKNSYQPLWIESNGFNKKVSSLFQAIKRDITILPQSKLYSDYTHLENQIENKNLHTDEVKMELKLTQLYLDLINHTLYGQINWKQFSKKLHALKRKRINATWVKNRAEVNISELLLNPSIEESIQKITPKRFGYKQLLLALERLQEFKKRGAWKKLPNFKVLKPHDQGDNVVKLRERLEASGDLKSCDLEAKKLFEEESTNEVKLKFQPRATFDECLTQAVIKFQKRHGLEADGIVGKETQRTMNQTVDYKIQKVLLNLDRIKWLPREEKSKQYIVVNIPEYMLHYIEEGETKQKLRVIVGDTKHPTPIFHNKISFIVLNPYWRVPEGITRKEIIPKVIKNIDYLRKQGLEIHQTWNERSPRIDPYSIYWEQYASGAMKFPYRIMQPPGKKNALGRIKFKFPNRYAVYLHDTPTRYLFKRDKRAFSHGCVRLSEPRELLKTIATFNSNINLKKADKTLKGKRQKQINIKNKLPIYLVYITAGLNAETKELEFREDIYNYDKMQNIEKYFH